MRFYTYVTRKYLDDLTMKGVLARSMKQDKNHFPKTRISHRVVRAFFEQSGASDHCLDAFEECWEEWKQCERSK